MNKKEKEHSANYNGYLFILIYKKKLKAFEQKSLTVVQLNTIRTFMQIKMIKYAQKSGNVWLQLLN